MPVSKILKQAEALLQHTSDAPRLDAEWLLLHVLGQRESSFLYAYGEMKLGKKTHKKFETLVQERATGKPLAYILGEWEFYGRPFYVTEDVLVPRPETENLIEVVLPFIDEWRKKHLGETMVIVDIGTGSGVIIITLALELSKFHIPYSKFQFLATDISPAALEVAKRNAARHGVQDQIEFSQGDMLAPLKNRTIDLIVSNPPYIPSHQIPHPVSKQVPHRVWNAGLKFEPRIALDGGLDGQDFIRQIQAAGIPAIFESTGGSITSCLQTSSRQV